MSLRMILKYVVFSSFLLPLSVFATDQNAIQQQLNQLIAKQQGKAQIAVVVQSLNSGQIIYQKNASQPLVPASSLKILTAYAALRQLGPEYTYKTQLLTDAQQPVSNGVLRGNLYIKFAGDPDLTTEEVDQLFATIREKGITTVTGGLMIDDGQYDNVGIAPGTVYSDKYYCYGVPIDAMNLNRNCISMTIKPAQKVGQRAQIIFMDNIPLLHDNNVITQGGGKKACGVSIRFNEETQRYQLNGCVKQKRPTTLRVVVNNKQYARTAVTALAQRNGIRVQGGVKKQQASPGLKVLATHNSEPVKKLVFTMLKKSDNLIANALFKTVGASYFKQPGSWDYGSKAVRQLIAANQRVNTSGMSVIDGSGLSRFNQITATQLTQVLRQAWYDTDVADYFFDGLPTSGMQGGSLKRRMGSKDMLGKVKAKTGTMKGVTALAGYVETHTREVLAFSIIVNGYSGSSGQYRILQDKICQVLRAA
jgi:D-alanyl-D-alanine carboxypeptidase/D-alanyl-D-alanine-endopeptidase (penicillin-binding protein 4)